MQHPVISWDLTSEFSSRSDEAQIFKAKSMFAQNCADHPYKSEGKSSAKWQMTPPLLVICQEMLVSSWLLLSSFLLKWKGWCIIFSFTLAMSTIFNAEWRCNLTVIKRIKLQLWRSRSCFRFALAKHYYFSKITKIINCLFLCQRYSWIIFFAWDFFIDFFVKLK